MRIAPELHVAALQIALHDAAPETNRDAIAREIEAISQPLDLLLLPEMFSTGFITDPRELAEPSEGETAQWMRAMAREHNIAICGSVVTREEGAFFNRLYLADSQGELQHYDKRHLFAYGGEDKFYTAGSQRVVMRLKGWRILPQICYDLRFPETARNHDGYDLLLYAACWPSSRNLAWRSLLRARAIENQVYTIGCNRVGIDSKGRHYQGSSMIIAPDGEIMQQLAPNGQGVIFATLEFSKQRAFRQQFPFLQDL